MYFMQVYPLSPLPRSFLYPCMTKATYGASGIIPQIIWDALTSLYTLNHVAETRAAPSIIRRQALCRAVIKMQVALRWGHQISAQMHALVIHWLNGYRASIRPFFLTCNSLTVLRSFGALWLHWSKMTTLIFRSGREWDAKQWGWRCTTQASFSLFAPAADV